MSALNGYHEFLNVINQHDSGKTVKALKEACKRKINNSSKKRLELEQNRIFDIVYDVFKVQETLYKDHQLTSCTRTFTLDLPFYNDKDNEVFKKIILNLFSISSFQTEIKDDGLNKSQITILSPAFGH